MYCFVLLQEQDLLFTDKRDGDIIHLYAQWKSIIKAEDIRVSIIRFYPDNESSGSEVRFTA